jgi:transaldolase
MAIFLDTAVMDEIRSVQALPFIRGLTTNPALMAKALGLKQISRADFYQFVREFSSAHSGLIFIQTIPLDLAGMSEDAFRIVEHVTDRERLVMKIPYGQIGLQVCEKLAAADIPVAMTALFDPLQAYAAVESGATYVIPYVNRLALRGVDPYTVVSEMLELLSGRHDDSALLAASIKSLFEVRELMRLGVHHLTLPLALIQELTDHEMSRKARDDFGQALSFCD